MQSKRINRIQRRAKRRFFALAIAGTVFVGYNALTLFAADDRHIQVPVTKMSTAPGVKAVGIRLINPNGSAQKPDSSAPTSRIDSLPMPLAEPVLSGPSIVLPSSPPNLSEGLAQLPLPPANSVPSQVDFSLPEPFPSQTSNSVPPSQSHGATVLSNLPTPPRMSEVLAKNPSGRVVIKLNGNEKDNASLSNKNNQVTVALPSSNSGNEVDAVDARASQPVRRPPSMFEPTKMPPFIFEKSTKRVETSTEQSVIPPSQTAVRISIGDNSEVEGGSRAKDRAPQLVKSKPTQIGHTVILAQSTDLETRSSENPNDEIVAAVLDVDTSLVPHFISNGLKNPGQKTASVSQFTAANSVKDAIESIPTPQGSNDEPNSFVDYANAAGGERRKFDHRLINQSPIATMELECLTATNMDLPSKLNAIAVQDGNICKVLQNERTLSLVGNQVGTTLVQIWTADLGDKPQVVRVNVSQPWSKVQATRNDLKDIKQVIAQGFPRAEVNIVSKEDGMIEVRGTTDSEESAKRILELVRKLYLVPVKDKLMVTK